MATVHDAVNGVIEYLQQFDQIMPVKGLRLEEFSLDESGENWLITFSFVEPQLANFVQAAVAARSYKTFTVNNQTGDVVSMKLRNPMAPLK